MTERSDLPETYRKLIKEPKALPRYAEGKHIYDEIKNDPAARKALSIATGTPERYLFSDILDNEDAADRQ